MIIKILGTGCPKCKALQASVEWVVKELWLDASVQKIEDMSEIMQYDIMATPALIVDEEVIFSGSIPQLEKIKKILSHKKLSKDFLDWSCCK